MTTTSPRRRARELVLQGLYQRQLSGNAARRDARRTSPRARGYARADQRVLRRAVARRRPTTTTRWSRALAPHLDRKPAELSPIERAILVIGAWELDARASTFPYRVVINEAVELAKSYGGTDGHASSTACSTSSRRGVRAAEIAALRASATRAEPARCGALGAAMAPRGEFALIARLLRRAAARPVGAPSASATMRRCSRRAPGHELVLAVDMMVEGRHFLADTDPDGARPQDRSR